MKTSTRVLWYSFAAVIAGGFGGSLWEPFNQSSSMWFMLVPLLLVIRKVSPRAAGWTAFGAGFISWCVQLSWMWALTDNNGPWLLILPGIAALSAYMALYYFVFAWIAASLRRRWTTAQPSWMRLLLLLVVEPLLWVGLECMRCKFLSGFAWNPLGLGLTSLLPLMQCAALGGIYLVSALVVLGNGAIASLIERFLWVLIIREPLSRKANLETILPLVLIVIAFYGGAARIRAFRQQPTRDVKVVSVQTDRPCVFTGNYEQERYASIDVFREFSDVAGMVHPDLVLWPESALYTALPNSTAQGFVADCARRAHAPIIVGCSYWQSNTEAYNAAIVFSSNATSRVYAKRHLVPFGEYIPLDKTFPVLQRFAPTGVSCTPGRDVKTLDVPLHDGTLVVGPLICFEDTVADVTRDSVNAGAQLLINISNDAWYSPSAEAAQHARQAIARCVETGVPMVRSTNGGFNCAISAIGQLENRAPTDKVVYRAGIHDPGIYTYTVALTERPFSSLYLVAGDWCFGYPALALTLVLLGWCWISQHRSRRIAKEGMHDYGC